MQCQPINGFALEDMKCRDPDYVVGLMGPHVYSGMPLPQKSRALLRANGRKPPMAQVTALQPFLINSQQVRAYRPLPRAQKTGPLGAPPGHKIQRGHHPAASKGMKYRTSADVYVYVHLWVWREAKQGQQEHGCVSLPRSTASSHLCKGGRSTVCSPPRLKVKAGAAAHDTHSTTLQSASHTIMTKAPMSGPHYSPVNQTTS